MRNFLQMAQDVDVGPLLHALATKPELWNQFGVRRGFAQTNHAGVDDVVLRYNRYDTGDDMLDKVAASTEVVNYPALELLPQARPLVFGLMARVEGEHLGRVVIARLPPGGKIPPHSDRIAEAEAKFPDRIPPAVYYERYHIVLKSQPGVQFRCGQEIVYMPPGSVWWFNNQEEHEVQNLSDDDRIHMVVDVALSKCWYLPK